MNLVKTRGIFHLLSQILHGYDLSCFCPKTAGLPAILQISKKMGWGVLVNICPKSHNLTTCKWWNGDSTLDLPHSQTHSLSSKSCCLPPGDKVGDKCYTHLFFKRTAEEQSRNKHTLWAGRISRVEGNFGLNHSSHLNCITFDKFIAIEEEGEGEEEEEGKGEEGGGTGWRVGKGEEEEEERK